MTDPTTGGNERVCVSCFEFVDESQAVQIVVSRDDEYYPRFDTVCKTCSNKAEDGGRHE